MSDEISGKGRDLDMFGQPVTPIRDRRGRPSFKKDKENQDFVSVRITAGWTQKQIADDMGIDEKTLRKHFSRELDNGAVLIEGVILDVLLRQTREGHAPSIRQLREISADGRRARTERNMGASAPPAAEERPGKKTINAQRAIDADADLMAELEREAMANARH